MKKNIFCIWLTLLAIICTVTVEAQMTIGGKKAPEPFSVLELLNKGGLRLPQITTEERNAYAVKNNNLGDGLTIYNKTTNCVEYWNKVRWVSLCEGDSQASISPQPCIDVAADGTGCDEEFTITDPDCPNGPFNIAIMAGGEYAGLYDLDNSAGTFKVAFAENNSVNARTVLVRVTSTCTSLYKEFLFSQEGIDCSTMSYTVPAILPSEASLTLCSGGSVYLSVPANTADLGKLIWTRNGIEVARGVSYYVASLPGKYNISMGAIGCNTNASNERTVTASGTVAPGKITAFASNNGVMCGTNSVTLSAVSSTGTIVWFHNGKEEKTGSSVSISGDSSVGEWFAAVKDGSCYSKQSNILTITKQAGTGSVSLPAADVLVNGVALNSFTAFCAGGTLDLSVANPKENVKYTWYNGNEAITSNPFTVPANQEKMTLRLVATDNTGASCPAEASAVEKEITSGSTPGQPNITGNATLCDGTTDLTLVPAAAGTYTYTWYKDNVKMTETTATITVTTPGVVYSGTVTNATGCTSTLAKKTISADVSSLPVLKWTVNPAEANFGAKVTLQTEMTFGPASSYTWTADGGATVTGSGASVSIQLPASGTDGDVSKITVFAENSCGKSEKIEHSIVMKSDCPTPVVSAQSETDVNVTAGSGTVLKVALATGTGVGTSYQWYTNTTSATTGGTAVSGATTASYTYKPLSAGTYYLYCIATNSCSGKPTGTSPSFKVTAAANPDSMPTGVGTFSGKTCFDIAESNFNTTCGLEPARTATKADFNLAATNTQTYTFTPSGTVSKVRFVYVESLSGALVKSITNNGNPTALNITKAVTATVVYQTTLSTSGGVQGTAYGKTTAEALTVDIYAIFSPSANGSAADVKVKLTAQIKDCVCCGAYVSPGVWKTFLCHDLGADTSLDPFTPAMGLIGDYYQYGENKPHTYGMVSPPPANAWYNNGKTAKDPCPAGYRVPSEDEWNGVRANNQMKAVGEVVDITSRGKGGWSFGPNLMLPVNGRRAIDSETIEVGSTQLTMAYRTSFCDGERTSCFFSIGANEPRLVYRSISDQSYGYAIRCISEN
ncbi:hypothetical protein [Flavobacterium gelatinilyticum]|uniref:hypothetical protein n=1 Tax=Flavobacterium gelatinilyticum TaxID=3003260 RepID=UPI00247FBE85|nr:hypothetical protein [Flavobacterium gelatinilyticum]